jgi:hypothetical protein
MNLGLRVDYFSYTKNTHISPRLSLHAQLSRKTGLTISAGIFRQHLPLLLLYRNETNKSLNEPLTYQYIVGIQHLMTPTVQLTVEGYYKDYRHFPIDPEQPSLCILDDLFGWNMFSNRPLVDQGRARSYGIEFTLQKKMKEKLYGMISGSLFRTQYRDMDEQWRNRIFENRYIFSVQGGYKPNKKWDISMRWIIAGGTPYTPFDLEASTAANTGIYDTRQINGKRMQAYHSMNLRVDRRYYFKGSNLTLYLSLWNAYNRKNPASYYWNEMENKADFSYQFSLLPILGIEYEF